MIEQGGGLTRRQFGKGTAAAGLFAAAAPSELPSVWRRTLGTPEKLTPVRVRRYKPNTAGLANLPPVPVAPVPVSGHATTRG